MQEKETTLAKVLDCGSIQVILKHSGICFRTILSHSEVIRKHFCVSFDEKR